MSWSVLQKAQAPLASGSELPQPQKGWPRHRMLGTLCSASTGSLRRNHHSLAGVTTLCSLGLFFYIFWKDIFYSRHSCAILKYWALRRLRFCLCGFIQNRKGTARVDWHHWASSLQSSQLYLSEIMICEGSSCFMQHTCSNGRAPCPAFPLRLLSVVVRQAVWAAGNSIWLRLLSSFPSRWPAASPCFSVEDRTKHTSHAPAHRCGASDQLQNNLKVSGKARAWTKGQVPETGTLAARETSSKPFSFMQMSINQGLFFSREAAVDRKVHKQVHRFSPPLSSSSF